MSHAMAHFETAHGICAIGWTERGICGFQLPASVLVEAERLARRRMPDAIATKPPQWVQQVMEAAKAYFSGERVDFSKTKLDLAGQNALFLEIYDAVRQLGWGETTTYGALAKRLGKERQVARDVGQAMARNPVPLIVPCHRVLAAGSKVGGFSAPGGAASKLRMLDLEGVAIAKASDAPAQRSLAL